MASASDTKKNRSRPVIEELIKRGLMSKFEARSMMEDFFKEAGARCPFQRHHKGCSQYARRPFGCRQWSCRWLIGDDTAELHRPDRSHYVIDPIPDFVRGKPHDGGDVQTIPVVQVWLDPDYPDAHRDPALRDYLMRRASEGYAALIRLSARDAFVLAAPPLTGRDWEEYRGNTGTEVEPQHSALETMAAISSKLGGYTIKLAADK
jgi:hypothetical protein